MRGATVLDLETHNGIKNFNPRTPCGVRLAAYYYAIVDDDISIHAPHAGCDHKQVLCTSDRVISIHAPHAGCDTATQDYMPLLADFNPRTPCGVRRFAQSIRPQTEHFNPRTPCGVRPSTAQRRRRPSHFNPRTPCGVRQEGTVVDAELLSFQSTHPMRGATRYRV